MKIRHKNIFEKHLHSAFVTGIEQPKRKRALRASGAPYCPILDVTRPDENEIADIFGTYFTSTGTAFHSTIQLFMSESDMGKYMWGDWKCGGGCGHVWKLQYRPSEACPNKCNSLPLYAEVPLRVGNHTGTCDFVANYKKRWVANDFKTCARIPARPKRQHLLQVRIYIAMLALNHNIIIDTYFITYFERTGLRRKAFGPYSTTKSLQQTKDWLFRAIAGFKAVTRFNKGDESALKDIVELRPCKSEDDFEDYMSRKEYTFNGSPCPMLQTCCKSSKHVLKALRLGGGLDA